MKRWLIVLFVLAMVAAACDSSGSDETTTSSAPTTTAAPGDGSTTTAAPQPTTTATTTPPATAPPGTPIPDTLNVHVAEFVTLNPFLSSGIGRATVTGIIYQPLVFLGPDSAVTGAAATSWEVSDDGLTWTFNLRDDLFWSDGEQFDSADVLFSMARYLNSDLSLWAGRIGGVLGQGEGDVPAGLAAPDPSTFEVTLAGPNASWLTILAAQGHIISMLPEHILGGMTVDELSTTEYFNETPVTMGPYTMVRWERDQFVELARDPLWPTPPAFNNVRLSFLQSDVASAQLETGDLHVSAQVAPLEASRLRDLDNLNVASTPGVWPEVLQFSVDDPLLQDPRVRQAMIYALDLDGICQEVLLGFCKVTWNQVRLLSPAWAIPDDITVYEYNPDKARELLAEAGWDESNRITLMNIGGQDRVRSTEAIIIQAAFQAVGIQTDILSTDVGTLLDVGGRQEGRRDEFQMFINRGAHFTADPSQVSPYNSCDRFYPNGANLSWYCNPDLDALWAAGLEAVTPEDRAPIYHDAFRILNEDPDVVVMNWPDVIVASNTGISGVQPLGQQELITWNIGEWTWNG
jgi:peptide/nickel transport system substrate-binding protein